MSQVFAISDLHLGPSQTKGHFSSRWVDHQPRLRRAWDERVEPDDVVLIPGDISWNTDAEDLKYELAWIEDRPGIKCVTRGNHDHGVWEDKEAITAMFDRLESVHLVHERAVRLACGIVVAGSMGAVDVHDRFFERNKSASRAWLGDDRPRYDDEQETLARVLAEATELREPGDGLCYLIHYPPFADAGTWTRTAWQLQRAGVDLCVYGHLHRRDQWERTFDGRIGDTWFRFVSADAREFKPRLVAVVDDELQVVNGGELLGAVARNDESAPIVSSLIPVSVELPGHSALSAEERLAETIV